MTICQKKGGAVEGTAKFKEVASIAGSQMTNLTEQIS
jgi:hypothetical protein